MFADGYSNLVSMRFNMNKGFLDEPYMMTARGIEAPDGACADV